MAEQPNFVQQIQAMQANAQPNPNTIPITKYYEYIGRLYVEALQQEGMLKDTTTALQARSAEVNQLTQQLETMHKELTVAKSSLAALQAIQPKTELPEDESKSSK